MNLKAMAIVVVGALFPVTGMAAEPVQIGKFSDWRAYTFDDPGGKICYVVSEPKSHKGNYTRRGDIFLLVTHRPAGKVYNEVSMIAGYTYKNGAEPVAKVSGRSFKFYTEGDAAWVFQKDEDNLVKEMKAGSTLVVTGTSSRGTKTTDTYSLSGITAALNAIDKECGR